MKALQLDDALPQPLVLDESPAPLSFDEPEPGPLVYTIRLFHDSPHLKVPNFLLFNRVIKEGGFKFKIVDVVDFDAKIEANPGEAYRLLKVMEV